MKKTFIAAAILLPAILLAQENIVIVEMDVRGRDCKGGIGLCDPPQIRTGTANTTGLKATASKVSDNKIAFRILNSSISTQEQSSLYGKLLRDITAKDVLYLNVDTLTVLDGASLRALAINPINNAIPPGAYLISVLGDYTEIIFDLKPGQ